MKNLRQYIRGLIKEMAYIDEYPPGYSGSPLQDPEVAANYHSYAARMKKKRANPPRTWQKVLNVLSAGGTLVEAGKGYLLYDANSKSVGSIRKKTFEELSADMERDRFMNAQEALEYGLVDEIVKNRDNS